MKEWEHETEELKKEQDRTYTLICAVLMLQFVVLILVLVI